MTPELPPLPVPLHTTDAAYDQENVPLSGGLSIFTADQMRSYGAECARAERERAEKAIKDALPSFMAEKIIAAIRKG